MPRTSGNENVKKLCKCDDYRSCRHPWYVDYCTRGVRVRANIEVRLGRKPKSESDAKRMAAGIIARVSRNPGAGAAVTLLRQIERDMARLRRMVAKLKA